jgi:hypothetical protein
METKKLILMLYSFHKYRISITTMHLDPLETFYEIYCYWGPSSSEGPKNVTNHLF